MLKIQFGKALSDIPIDKISSGMRVAMKNTVDNCLTGTVCYVKKNTFGTVNVSGTPGVANTYTNKIDSITIDWDNGPVLDYEQSLLNNTFYIEEIA